MFYTVILKLAYWLTLLLFKVDFVGLENIPKEEGFILAPNHRTWYDPIFCATKLPRQMHFMAKEELFSSRFMRWVLPKLNAYPIARGKGDSSTLVKSKEILQAGNPILIFPEGTRSKTGRPGRPRSGAVLLATQAGVGIVPCTIDFGEKLRFRSRVTVKYHPIITNEELNVDLDSPRTLRTASKMVMNVITSGITRIPLEDNTKKDIDSSEEKNNNR